MHLLVLLGGKFLDQNRFELFELLHKALLLFIRVAAVDLILNECALLFNLSSLNFVLVVNLLQKVSDLEFVDVFLKLCTSFFGFFRRLNLAKGLLCVQEMHWL